MYCLTLLAMPGLVVIRDSKVLWSGYEIADLEKVLDTI